MYTQQKIWLCSCIYTKTMKYHEIYAHETFIYSTLHPENCSVQTNL